MQHLRLASNFKTLSLLLLPSHHCITTTTTIILPLIFPSKPLEATENTTASTTYNIVNKTPITIKNVNYLPPIWR